MSSNPTIVSRVFLVLLMSAVFVASDLHAQSTSAPQRDATPENATYFEVVSGLYFQLVATHSYPEATYQYVFDTVLGSLYTFYVSAVSQDLLQFEEESLYFAEKLLAVKSLTETKFQYLQDNGAHASAPQLLAKHFENSAENHMATRFRGI